MMYDIYDVNMAAELLRCSVKTIEQAQGIKEQA